MFLEEQTIAEGDSFFSRKQILSSSVEMGSSSACSELISRSRILFCLPFGTASKNLRRA
jgi:hypothetical protein